MTDHTCQECQEPVTAGANGRLCNQCKWKSRPRVPCAQCGGPTGWAAGSKKSPSSPRCSACRGRGVVKHGTRYRYRKGCRCEECSAASAAEQRSFTALYRARNGYSYRKNFGGHETSFIPRAERYAIYERDGWVCQICFEPVDPDLPGKHRMAATLDHIEPRSLVLIPDHSAANLRLAHRVCNSRRGNRVSPSGSSVG